MNFVISRDVLLNNLNNINRGLSTKTTQPILKGIKIDVEKGRIILTSSSSNISVQSIITEDVEISSTGSVIIPGKFFIEIIRKVNTKDITISQMDGNTIHITTGKSNFTLNGMDLLDYPNIDFALDANPIEFSSTNFKNLIKQTTFSASTMENRPVLTGVNFKLQGSNLICVATDSYRLSQKSMVVENSKNISFVIPASSLIEFNKILEDSSSDIKMHINDSSVLFEYDNTLFKTRLLEGNYPETSKLIPEEFPVIIKFNKDDLITAVEHASLLSTSEASSHIIKLNLRPDMIVEITSNNSEIGKVLEEVHPIDKVKGKSLQIAFSSKYILDALRVLNSSEVSLNFTGEIRPFTITGEMDNDVIQLILPVRTE